MRSRKVRRLRPWIAKTLIGLLMLLAVCIAIECWATDNVLTVIILAIIFYADCIVLNKFGEIQLIEYVDKEDRK